MEMFRILMVVAASQGIYSYKNVQTVHFKWMQFNVHKLDLNKIDFKNFPTDLFWGGAVK